MTTRTVTMLDPYNLDTNGDFVKVVDNHKNHNHLYEGLKGLASYEGDFTTLSSPLKVAI
ncbi:hypothetical protein C8034_v002814 [Colletotrichum sidae]|uniref:Uncharacterized protein n=1 Tax=Colletotrichum sidae TaxID=1347389 RepID=A0A4R8SN30_9PEZI|nr:hypothetical protein C8034_v002814 [Colletotrichum sidae]